MSGPNSFSSSNGENPIANAWQEFEENMNNAYSEHMQERQPKIIGSFEVGAGLSKEAEFKRLTGEDWPGVNYIAESNGADGGDDGVFETWTIRERTESEKASPNNPTNDKPTPKQPDWEPIEDPDDYINSSPLDPDSLTPTPKQPDWEPIEDPDDYINSSPLDPDSLTPENQGKNPEADKVEVGDIKIEGIIQEFEEDKTKRMEELKEKLDKMLPELSELYARNRRLIVGAKNRAEFARVKGEYGEMLDEYLKLKGKKEYNEGRQEISAKLDQQIENLRKEIETKLIEFAGGDLEKTEKTQEEMDAEKQRLIDEAEKTLRAEYSEMIKKLETEVNANFVEDYIAEATKLEDDTIDKLDNGTICRKFVNKVLNNKYLKGALAGAAIAGLAITGVGLAAGLAAGTAAIGLSFTAGGVALGAGKGALSGTIFSRQDSKNSAIRGLSNEEEIRKNLENINILGQDKDANNVAGWLMDQYEKADKKDRSSNWKRTAVSAGIGAAIGAFASGVQINNVSQTSTTRREIVAHRPDKTHYELDVDINKVVHPNDDGIEGFCVRDAKLVSSTEEFYKPGGLYDIIIKTGQKYGLVERQHGWSFVGTLKDWTNEAASTMREAINEALARGIIGQKVTTAGEPIYGIVTRVTQQITPDVFRNFLTRASAIVGAGAIGGGIAAIRNRANRNRAEQPESSAETPDTPASEEAPDSEAPETSEPIAETEPNAGIIAGIRAEIERLQHEADESAKQRAELEATLAEAEARLAELEASSPS